MPKMTIKAHYITFFYLIRSYWLVFTAPLVRIVVQFIIYKDARLILPAELVLLVLAILAAVVGWLSIKIIITDNNIIVKRGVFVKSCANIELSRLFEIYTSQSLLHVIFGCVKCCFNTASKKDRGLMIMLSTNSTTQVIDAIYGKSRPLTLARQNKAKRFFLFPLATSVITTIIAVLTLLFLKRRQNYLLLIILPILLNLYCAYVCYYNYKHGKLALGNDIFASVGQALNIRGFCCSKNKVGIIKMSQNPFDVRYDTCKIKITGWEYGGNSIKIKHIRKNTAIRQIRQIFKINTEV